MTWFHTSVATAATLWILIQARTVLAPFLIALFLWFLLNAVARAIAHGMRGAGSIPGRVEKSLASIGFFVLFVVIANLIGDNARALAGNLPTYQANLDAILAKVMSALGFAETADVDALIARVDLSSAVIRIAGSAAALLSTSVIVLVYVVFLFVESGTAERKLAAIMAEGDERQDLAGLIVQINHDIERYLGIKLILGIVQALPTYIILAAVGVDGPGFWAVVIFFSSFIPTVGSLIGIVFPSLLTIAQFGAIGPFVTVLGTLGAVQLFASNWLEPQLMGRTLNLSPLAILLAIFAGGAVWGIVGALIVVPVLAICMMVFARVPALRPVAILLSADGQIDRTLPPRSDNEGTTP